MPSMLESPTTVPAHPPTISHQHQRASEQDQPRDHDAERERELQRADPRLLRLAGEPLGDLSRVGRVHYETMDDVIVRFTLGNKP